VEEEKGEDKGGGSGGQVLVKCESDWCATLVVVMSLLRHISRCDRVPPPGVIGRTPALTGSGDLAPGCSSF